MISASITEPTTAVNSSNYAIAYNGLFINNSGQFFLPPISQVALLQLMDANPYYAACVQFDVQMLLAYFLENPIISADTLSAVATEFNLTGNGYLRWLKNIGGYVIGSEYQPSAYTVRLTEKNLPWGIPPTNNQFGLLLNGQIQPWPENDIFQFKNRDPLQPIYGKPIGMAAIKSALLGEACVLAPIKALKNGTSGKFIISAGLNELEKKELAADLSNNKDQEGRTIYINAENIDSAEKIIKIFYNDVMFKVDYDRFANMSANAIYAMWGVPPVLIGQTAPDGTSYPDLDKMFELYYKMQVIPNQQRFSVINKYLPKNNNLYFFKPKFDDDFMVTQILEPDAFNKFQGVTLQRPGMPAFQVAIETKNFKHGQVVFFDGEKISLNRPAQTVIPA